MTGGGDMQQITVTIPGVPESRATIAGDYGNGTTVDRCLLQVYRNGVEYGEQQEAAVNDGKATFNLRLVAAQEYDFVFWADREGYYTTTDLTAITRAKEYTGNDDGFDAFFGALTDYTVNGTFAEEITLKRPFGQLNITTTDLADVPDANLRPTHVTVAFTAIPTTFDALTGTVDDATEAVTYTAPVVNADGELSVDYILANPEEASLADFTVTFLNGATTITTNDAFKSIPVRRNYRTNVSGNLLTKAGDFSVTVDPIFEEPAINDYPELRAAFAEGGRVVLNEDVMLDAPLVLSGDKTVDIDLNGHDIINNVSVPDATAPQCGNTTVFEVNGGATLNIRGEGKVHAISSEPNEDGYRIAVYAMGNSTVNIYGGDFMNDQDYNNHNAQLDLIYADHQAVINIYGGRFESKCANSSGYWVLNLKDNSEAQINVHGGTFVNFDPSNAMTEPAPNRPYNFVVSTSTVVKVSDEPSPNGTYEVVPADGELVFTEAGQLEIALNSGLENVTKIRVDGPVSSADMRAIQNLLKTDADEGEVDAALEILDLSQAEGLTNNVAISYNSIGSASSISANYTLKEIILPEGITSLHRWGFASLRGLTEINIPSTVTKIGDRAFSHCEALESIVLPEGLTEILDGCFYNATSLKSVNIPNSVTAIRSSAFYNTALENVVLGSGVEVLERQALYYIKGLKSVDMSASKIKELTVYNTIGDRYDGALAELKFPATLTSIAANAIASWSKITTVTCLATTPPTVTGTIRPATGAVLYVPAEAVDAYKAAAGWNVFSVQAIVEY